MSLLVGTVSVTTAGSVVKSGAAGRLYDILALTAATAIPGGIPSGSAGYKIKKGIADLANDFAVWLVAELTTQATVIIPMTSIVSGVSGASATGPAAPLPLSIT